MASDITITITIPEIPPEAIAALDQHTTEAFESEVSALAALRTKYGPLAKQNGYVKTGHWWRGNQNWSESRNYHYARDGKQIKGLLALDEFTEEYDSEFTGRWIGSRLYLLETSEWLLITRDGHWSQFRDASEWWSCDPNGFGDGKFEDVHWGPNGIVTLSDAQVAERFELDDIVKKLGESLKGLQDRIPQRMTKLKQRTELAQRLMEELTK